MDRQQNQTGIDAIRPAPEIEKAASPFDEVTALPEEMGIGVRFENRAAEETECPVWAGSLLLGVAATVLFAATVLR